MLNKSIALFTLTIFLIVVCQFQGLSGYSFAKSSALNIPQQEGKRTIEPYCQPSFWRCLMDKHEAKKELEGRNKDKNEKIEKISRGGESYLHIDLNPSALPIISSNSPPIKDSSSLNSASRPIYNLYKQGEYQKVIGILSNYREEDLKAFDQYLLAVSYQKIGQFSLAVKHWYKAHKSYENRGNYRTASYCLLQLAQGYIYLGRTEDALSLLQNWSYPLPVFAKGVLGNAYLAAGKYQEAISSYKEALKTDLNSQQRLAVLNNLASGYEKLALSREKSAQMVISTEEQQNLLDMALKAEVNAKNTREEAWLMAQNFSHPSAIKAKLNWLQYTPNKKEILEGVAQDIEVLPVNHRKIQLFISLAKVSPQSEIYLQRALQLADEIQDNLGLAITNAELGKFYERQQKYEMALSYAEEAQTYIYPLLFYDYLYQYQWQEARIYEALNQPFKAKSAYRRSLESLDKIRPQIAFSGNNAQFNFQESIEPIYRRLLTLLLTDNPSQSDLQQSLQVFEQFQLAQLENLFADICFEKPIQDVTKKIQEENLVIITPIILDEKVHVIAFSPDGNYYHHAEKISAGEINRKIKQWRLDLLDVNQQKYFANSTFFYNLLFKPFEAIMSNINPSTIVFVNDGLLRNVPMAALYDAENKQFLIEKYPISVALGQNFLPSVSPPLANNSLAFGLSKAIPPVNIALPNVEAEIKSVQKIIDANTGLNQEFTQENLGEKIKENNLSVLHLASHGEFTGLIENSFIQAYDKIITTPELEQILIEADRIDLLTLSACETAAGDNRAVMGLAGVAIRTGIPAVLSTLWSVSDLTTPRIITDFYQHWQQGKNKAQALQKVQIEQIRSSSHPRIWAAFVLIGI